MHKSPNPSSKPTQSQATMREIIGETNQERSKKLGPPREETNVKWRTKAEDKDDQRRGQLSQVPRQRAKEDGRQRAPLRWET